MNENPTNMLTQTQIMDALNRRHSRKNSACYPRDM